LVASRTGRLASRKLGLEAERLAAPGTGEGDHRAPLRTPAVTLRVMWPRASGVRVPAGWHNGSVDVIEAGQAPSTPGEPPSWPSSETREGEPAVSRTASAATQSRGAPRGGEPPCPLTGPGRCSG